MLHKARENRQTILVRPEKILGMPLDGPGKTLAEHLCRFDDAVGSDGHRRQTFAKVFDGLVVQRVHLEDVFA